MLLLDLFLPEKASPKEKGDHNVQPRQPLSWDM
jgi:hypothetical protein